MSHYFFNLFTPTISVPDTLGQILPDARAAAVEAVRLVGAILDNEGRRRKLGEHWYLEVTDRKGQSLFRLSCTSRHEPGLTPHPASSRLYLH